MSGCSGLLIVRIDFACFTCWSFTY